MVNCTVHNKKISALSITPMTTDPFVQLVFECVLDSDHSSWLGTGLHHAVLTLVKHSAMNMAKPSALTVVKSSAVILETHSAPVIPTSLPEGFHLQLVGRLRWSLRVLPASD